MNAITTNEPSVSHPDNKVPYWHIYNDTRSMILTLSGLSVAQLDDTALELEVDYELFCADYKGTYVADAHVGFSVWAHDLPSTWEGMEDSALNGLSMAQYFFAWAWAQNNAAMFCCGGKAVAQGWSEADAMACGVVAAVSAAKSLCHAKALLDAGASRTALDAG